MKLQLGVALAALLMAGTPAAADTLSNGLSDTYTDIIPSNIFTLDNACGCTPTWSSAAIDSFTLSTRSRLTAIDAALIEQDQNGPDFGTQPHFGGFDRTNGYQVNIYSSAAAAAANLTGDIYSVTLAPGAVSFGGPLAIDDPAGYILPYSAGSTLATLPIDKVLSAGTYWLSVISLNDPDVDGQESIFVGVAGTGNAALANPGGSWGTYFGDGTLFPFGSQAGYAVQGVAGVPEPASWALMIAGVGGTGGALRRRHKLAVRTA